MDDTTFSQFAMDMRYAAERSACAAGCDTVSAEDVASETMLSLWMIRKRLTPATCVAYARAAARHKAINTFRAKTVRLETNAHPTPIEPSAEDTFIAQEDVDWL